jgi:hypothetical protein
MKKRIVGLLVSLVLIIILGVGWLYQYGGLKYYLRAVSDINDLEEEDRQEAKGNFLVDKEQFYSGTLAGTWANKVWVWGNKGLNILRWMNIQFILILMAAAVAVQELSKKN